MTAATVTSKGQLTLPKDVRAALGVGPGDRVDFVRMEDGNFAVLPATHSVKKLKGIIAKTKRPISLADMEKAIAQGAGGKGSDLIQTSSSVFSRRTIRFNRQSQTA